MCKRASAMGLFEQRNGCASKVKITPTHAHTQGMGQGETLLSVVFLFLLAAGPILYLIP